jgi:TonB family protein
MAGVPANAQSESGSAAFAHTGESRGPRPGPNFPTLESYYPATAKRAGQEGAAIIHFCVDPNGRLTEAPTITTSSGNEALDEAALNLANAGSGLYLPAYSNGVAKLACSQFKIKFELRDDTVLQETEDPRMPTISARLRALSIEYGARMAEVEKVVDMPKPVMLAPQDPAMVRTIRQFARALDAALDQSVGIVADMLDDMEYLGKSRDIPEQERAIFVGVWPDERAGLARSLRQMIGASRDVVRSMDEMADYVIFSTPRRSPEGTAGASLAPEQDPQMEDIRERALKAIRRLQSSVNALSKASPAAGDRGQ